MSCGHRFSGGTDTHFIHVVEFSFSFLVGAWSKFMKRGLKTRQNTVCMILPQLEGNQVDVYNNANLCIITHFGGDCEAVREDMVSLIIVRIQCHNFGTETYKGECHELFTQREFLEPPRLLLRGAFPLK